MESFLVALAMAILKYYGPKVAFEIERTWKEFKELQENEKKAEAYEEIINSPADRTEREKIEDDLLS
jgi:hypothetical protein